MTKSMEKVNIRGKKAVAIRVNLNLINLMELVTTLIKTGILIPASFKMVISTGLENFSFKMVMLT